MSMGENATFGDKFRSPEVNSLPSKNPLSLKKFRLGFPYQRGSDKGRGVAAIPLATPLKQGGGWRLGSDAVITLRVVLFKASEKKPTPSFQGTKQGFLCSQNLDGGSRVLRQIGQAASLRDQSGANLNSQQHQREAINLKKSKITTNTK